MLGRCPGGRDETCKSSMWKESGVSLTRILPKIRAALPGGRRRPIVDGGTMAPPFLASLPAILTLRGNRGFVPKPKLAQCLFSRQRIPDPRFGWRPCGCALAIFCWSSSIGAGPRCDFNPRDDQQGYIPIEWWPDDFDAIRFAIGRGIIVVEAGGNGAENLDDPLMTHPQKSSDRIGRTLSDGASGTLAPSLLVPAPRRQKRMAGHGGRTGLGWSFRITANL